MYIQLHERFQSFLDKIIKSNDSLHAKKRIIKEHLLTYQNEYEQMLLSFFKEEELTNDTYFYITYTYQDLPIDLNKEKEMVVSFLYDLENGMYFELVVFNEEEYGTETKDIFSCSTDFYC